MRSVALVLAMLATPAAAATDQFDLICKSGKESLRYRVDLSSREWCWEDCKFGTWRIADVTSSRIVLKDEHSDTSDTSNVIERASGVNHRYNRDRYGTMSSTWQCEPASFSGFPKAKF